MSDWKRIVEGIKSNNKTSMEEAYLLTKDEIYINLRSKFKTVDLWLLEDSIQDAYIKAFNKINQLDNPDYFMAWIKSIARNQCLDNMKKEGLLSKEVGSISVRSFSTLLSDNQNDISRNDITDNFSYESFIKEKSNVKIQEIINEIIDSLPYQERTALVLNKIDAYTYKEVAKMMGVSVASVERYLRKGELLIEKEAEILKEKGIKLYSYSPIFILTLYCQGLRSQKLEKDLFSGVLTQTDDNFQKQSGYLNKIKNMNRFTKGVSLLLICTFALATGLLLNSKKTILPSESEGLKNQTNEKLLAYELEAVYNAIDFDEIILWNKDYEILIINQGGNIIALSDDGNHQNLGKESQYKFFFLQNIGYADKEVKVVFQTLEGVNNSFIFDNSGRVSIEENSQVDGFGMPEYEYRFAAYEQGSNELKNHRLSNSDGTWKYLVEDFDPQLFMDNPFIPIYQLEKIKLSDKVVDITVNGVNGQNYEELDKFEFEESELFKYIAPVDLHRNKNYFVGAVNDEGKFGYLNSSNEMLIPFDYELPNGLIIKDGFNQITPCSDESNLRYFFCGMRYSDELTVNINGKAMIESENFGNELSLAHNGNIAVVGIEGKTHLINKNLEISEDGFDKVYVNYESIFAVDNGKVNKVNVRTFRRSALQEQGIYHGVFSTFVDENGTYIKTDNLDNFKTAYTYDISEGIIDHYTSFVKVDNDQIEMSENYVRSHFGSDENPIEGMNLYIIKPDDKPYHYLVQSMDFFTLRYEDLINTNSYDQKDIFNHLGRVSKDSEIRDFSNRFLNEQEILSDANAYIASGKAELYIDKQD